MGTYVLGSYVRVFFLENTMRFPVSISMSEILFLELGLCQKIFLLKIFLYFYVCKILYTVDQFNTAQPYV